nr:Chain B, RIBONUCLEASE A [synthetic construct]
PYVPVHFNASV